LAALSGCTSNSDGSGGEGGNSHSSGVSTRTYSLGAYLSPAFYQLNSAGQLQMAGAMAVSVAAGQTSQRLASSLPSGTGYSVTVQTQPTGETCMVAGGSGTMQWANVANVAVSCTDQTYFLGGSISGLNGAGLVLANGTDTLTLGSGATSFIMPTPVAYTSTYGISIQTQPAGLTCAVGNGTGTMPTSAVTNVAITCADQPFSLGGTIGGLGNKAGLTLTNGSDTIEVAAGSTSFTMPKPVAFGSGYSVAVQSAPPGLVCSESNGAGTMGAADVTSVSITCGSNFTLLHSFAGGSSDGADPYHILIQASDGDFYGSTLSGGSSNGGTIYEITPSGTQAVLHTFPKTGTDGQTPYAGVIQGDDGNFYGTTYFGGSNGLGTVFIVTPGGTETVLYSFAGGSDGAHPYAGLIQGGDGNFYGTTYQGGTSGDGAVFKVTPSGTETILYSFVGGSSDGANPEAGLTQGSDGNFYGNTYLGGASNLGTVFKLTPTGTETVLHSFAGGSSDGANPSANLIQSSDGNLYGSTGAGGPGGDGTFFKVALQ
jgi:uncharacterized repeat protein (TIGR03803 family)